MPELITQNHKSIVNYFEQSLHPSNLIIKPMKMLLILGGTFQMGSPETELDRSDCESPQHQVTVPTFFMSEYPISKVHWLAVNQMPQVKIKLENPLSYFKNGNSLPVESINWFEALEFCTRLSRHSGRIYRLPTEAEWEYACRAGSTTPFNFGETITTDLANYRGVDNGKLKLSSSYGKETKGIYRQETTSVDTFLPNVLGLYDMHGNLWEWCLDHWHDNYRDAPVDGSAWISGSDDARRVVRGGAWSTYPHYCRSASRSYFTPINRYFDLGFRVVCEFPRTL